jgi:hypothetical protein
VTNNGQYVWLTAEVETLKARPRDDIGLVDLCKEWEIYAIRAASQISITNFQEYLVKSLPKD